MIPVSTKLQQDIARHYRVRSVTVAEVRDEYRMLVRKGFELTVGDVRLEPLRDIFVRHGLDPLRRVQA